MRRPILSLMFGLFGTMLIISIISVYGLHDVDREMIGHWNKAFFELTAESVVFTLIVGGGVAAFLSLGRRILHLKDHPPRAMLGTLLGVGIPLVQYPWDIAVRAKLPKLADAPISISGTRDYHRYWRAAAR